MRGTVMLLIALIASASQAQTTQPAPSLIHLQSAGEVLPPLTDQAILDNTTGRRVITTVEQRPSPNLVREGTIITDRVATLSHDDQATAILTFDHDDQYGDLPPMPVLPSSRLMAMESAAGNSTKTVKFHISGTITEFNYHNAILLEEVIEPVPPAAEPPAVQQPPADSQPAPSGPGAKALQNLFAPTTRGNSVSADATETDKTTGQNAVAPNAESLNTIREGTTLFDRVVRLTRGQDGAPEISFEADGKNMADPPMLALQNLKLQTMQDAAGRAARPLKFRVTGLVTEYKGRNQLLLQKVVVIPESSQRI